ncbi:transporter substrate-binding domain-containing protein [Leucobacter sp. NPDC077196]|uniref:transporter substrate-binding domain-containing protein n=1 Tax=Leucobacter sp. NPDC077196 TaxID=3154959 RepID=UPI003415E217
MPAQAEGETCVIATDTTFAPFEFRDPSTGDLVGIDMDLMNTIAEQEGFTVDIRSLGFQAALSAVQSGQADGVIAGCPAATRISRARPWSPRRVLKGSRRPRSSLESTTSRSKHSTSRQRCTGQSWPAPLDRAERAFLKLH